MNVANLRALAKHLRTPLAAKHFDLETYFDLGPRQDDEPVAKAIRSCGTVACIAGHALVLSAPADVVPEEGEEIHDRAAAWLGLDAEQAHALFLPAGTRVNYMAVTAAIAANVVERLANTGEVLWPDAVLWP